MNQPGDRDAAFGELHRAALETTDSLQRLQRQARAAARQARERIETQAETLAASASLLRATLESTLDGVMAIDLAARLVVWNSRFVAMWGLPPGMAESGNYVEVTLHIAAQLRNPTRYAELVRQAIEQPEVEVLETLELADGRTFDRYASPQRLDGRCVGVVVNWRDMTARVRASAALHAQQVAEAANRAKSDFLARMSHELRTPLNAILGFSDMLALGTDPPPTAVQRRQLEHIHRAGASLLELINDVLDVSRVEAGMVRIALNDVDAAAVVRDAVAQLQPQAVAAQVSIDLQTTPAAGACRVRADRARLLQVLQNLVSNAVKYNVPNGRVRLGVRCAPAARGSRSRSRTPASACAPTSSPGCTSPSTAWAAKPRRSKARGSAS